MSAMVAIGTIRPVARFPFKNPKKNPRAWTRSVLIMEGGHARNMRKLLQESAFAFTSPDEHSALVQMLIDSLPLPPLPVMVLDGFPQLEREDSLASSFDFLRHAIVAHQLAQPVGGSAPALVRAKCEVVNCLRRDMSAHCSQAADNTANRAWVQGAYGIFCNALRTYILRCTSLTEVRFFPIAAVMPDSALVQQGSLHWQGSWGGARDRTLVCEDCSGAHFSSYENMVRSYALHVGSAGEHA